MSRISEFFARTFGRRSVPEAPRVPTQQQQDPDHVPTEREVLIEELRLTLGLGPDVNITSRINLARYKKNASQYTLFMLARLEELEEAEGIIPEVLPSGSAANQRRERVPFWRSWLDILSFRGRREAARPSSASTPSTSSAPTPSAPPRQGLGTNENIKTKVEAKFKPKVKPEPKAQSSKTLEVIPEGDETQVEEGVSNQCDDKSDSSKTASGEGFFETPDDAFEETEEEEYASEISEGFESFYRRRYVDRVTSFSQTPSQVPYRGMPSWRLYNDYKHRRRQRIDLVERGRQQKALRPKKSFFGFRTKSPHSRGTSAAASSSRSSINETTPEKSNLNKIKSSRNSKQASPCRSGLEKKTSEFDSSRPPITVSIKPYSSFSFGFSQVFKKKSQKTSQNSYVTFPDSSSSSDSDDSWAQDIPSAPTSTQTRRSSPTIIEIPTITLNSDDFVIYQPEADSSPTLPSDITSPPESPEH